MIYRVIYSGRALETFDLIKTQIDGRWGQKHSDIFEQRVLELIDLIQHSPFIFESVKNDERLRRCVVHKNCSMYYEVETSLITIHFFMDNRQDPLF